MNVLQDLESRILPPALLHADGVPSASIAILSDGKITSHVITSGSENEDTIYQSCSISKAITGLAIAKLVEQGKLSYSTPIKDHLRQEVIDILIDKETAHLLPLVTVSMILSHTSGLTQGGFAGYEDESPSTTTVLSGKAPSNTLRVRFGSFPGAQCSYSGGGFTVLQIFMEELLGLPFPQIMQDLVLKPLGMTRSHYGRIPKGEENYADAYHTAYVKCSAGHHDLPELAAAGLWTTATDLLKAIGAVQESLRSDEGFLKTDVAKSLLEAKHHCWSNDNCSSHGFFVTDQVFAHSGSNEPGYRCFAFGSHGGAVDTSTAVKDDSGKQENRPKTLWDTGNGLAVMTNSKIGTPILLKILQAVFYLKKWPMVDPIPSWPFPADSVPYIAPADIPIEAGWQEWKGSWQRGWKLEDRDGSPVLGFQDAGLIELRPAAAPSPEGEDGKRSILLVAMGLNIAVNLSWDGSERVLRVIQDSAKTLRRV